MDNLDKLVGEWVVEDRKIFVFIDRNRLLRAYDPERNERRLAVNVVWSDGAKVSDTVPSGVEEAWCAASWAEE